MTKGLNTKGIEGIRGIGALGIALFAHYYLFAPYMVYPFYGKLTYWFWNYSGYLVDLFFVISGFVMAYAYEDKIAGEKIGFASFMKRRFLRLYPFMIFTLFLTLLLQLYHQYMCGEFFAAEYVCDNTLFSFLMNVLCLQSTGFVGTSFNAPSWYVSAVILLYVCYYVTVRLGKSLHIGRFAYLIPLFAGIIIAYFVLPVHILNCRGLTGFFTGCLLYHFVMYVNNIKRDWLRKIVIYGITLVWAVICLSVCVKGHVLLPVRNDLVVVFYELVVWPGLVFAAVLIPAASKLLSFKGFTYFGRISYHMYLIHYPVMIILDNFNVLFKTGINYESRKFFILYAAVLIVISACCHYDENILKRTYNEKKLQNSDCV
jgi:peptidoglycan/LPS O-acetylase OafA/YrhL